MTTTKQPVLTDTPRTDALTAQWDDDGATRGPAYTQMRDLARLLEIELQTVLARAGVDAVREQAFDDVLRVLEGWEHPENPQGNDIADAIRALKVTPAAAVADAQPIAHRLLFDGRAYGVGWANGAPDAATVAMVAGMPTRWTMQLAYAAPQAGQLSGNAGEVGLPVSQEPKYTVNGHAIVNRASGEVIPADEPVFIFRARDMYAYGALVAYAKRLPSGPHQDAVFSRAHDFDMYRRNHRNCMKVPDTAAIAARKGAKP